MTPRSPSSVTASASAILRAACFVTMKVPTRLTSITFRNASRSYSVTREAQPMPAQLTAPCNSSMSPMSASTAASSVTSHSGRSATTARAPAASSSRAVAAPSPDLPPVTRTVLPSSLNGRPIGNNAELLAERGLAELADRRFGDLVDELEAVAQLPLRELGRDVLAQLLPRRRLALLEHDDGERALLPLLVRHRDYRRLGDGGVAHDRVLERHRGDPLAAGLDDVLRAVLDLDVAPLLDRDDVARFEPAVVGPPVGLRVVLVVAGRDPGAAHLELAHRLAVPRDDGPVLVDGTDLDERRRRSLLGAVGELDVLGSVLERARQLRDGAERRHFRHAPRMADVDAMSRLEALD